MKYFLYKLCVFFRFERLDITVCVLHGAINVEMRNARSNAVQSFALERLRGQVAWRTDENADKEQNARPRIEDAQQKRTEHSAQPVRQVA